MPHTGSSRFALTMPYLGLAQMVDNLLDGKSLLGHLITPFFQGPRRPTSLTKHLDPVKGGRSHASIHNHFNHDRHLNRRVIFKQNRAAALAEWCELMA